MKSFEPHAIDDSAWDGTLLGDVKAGFPTMTEELREEFDIKQLIVRHPASTFYFIIDGVSMIDAAMDDGDVIIVDRSIEPYDGCKAICYVDGEFTVKRVEMLGDKIRLMPMSSNPKYRPIEIDASNDFSIWGIVTYIIKKA